MPASRWDMMKAVAVLLVNQWAERQGWAQGAVAQHDRESKVVVVTCGGMRRSETFAIASLDNIPHLRKDMLPQAAFFPFLRNDGVTSHYNTISSILTGTWQRLDDWGKTPPASATIYEHLRKRTGLERDRAWFISSNKALTNKIGASSLRDFGPRFGANVVFPKQLLINAVIRAAERGRPVRSSDRTTVQPELEAMLNAQNYDGLGWSVGESSQLDAASSETVRGAIEDLVRINDPVTGDEFTYLVSTEVMRRFMPSLLVITFSDMEVAHFGSYSLYLAGIRTVDRLLSELWNTIQSLPAYKDCTTLFVLPEFGRDLDGSVSNGFFNHRQDNDCTRLVWMMCLGERVRKAQIIEETFSQTDLCPTIGRMFGLGDLGLKANVLQGLWM